MDKKVTEGNERISIVAAISRSRRALGKDNRLLWYLPGDLPRFKKLTLGHPIIMGRKTFESIGKALPGRTNIVLSHNPDFAPPGVTVTASLETAFGRAAQEKTGETFIIGGAKIYELALPRADRLYLTIVDDEPDADAFFPPYEAFSMVIERESHFEQSPSFEYITLEKN